MCAADGTSKVRPSRPLPRTGIYIVYCIGASTCSCVAKTWTPPVQKLGGPDPSTPCGCAYTVCYCLIHPAVKFIFDFQSNATAIDVGLLCNDDDDDENVIKMRLLPSYAVVVRFILALVVAIITQTINVSRISPERFPFLRATAFIIML